MIDVLILVTVRGGGFLIAVMKDFPSKLIIISDIRVEHIFVQVIIDHFKFMLCGSYFPHQCLLTLYMANINFVNILTTYQYFVAILIFLISLWNNDNNGLLFTSLILCASQGSFI